MSHRISLQPGNHTFEADDDQTVLEAALAAGLLLPHGCRDGARGACKGPVVEGEVEHAQRTSRAHCEGLRAEGLALFCCAKPRGDLVVQARSVTRAGDIQVKKLPCRVQKLERLAEDVMRIELKLPAIDLIRCGGGDLMAAQREQWNDGSNTLCIAPGRVITYERNSWSNKTGDMVQPADVAARRK